jgi:anti-sigma B factor antagonist
MIEFAEESRSGWCVIDVRGRADGLAADDLESALRQAIERNPKVAADFSSLDYISSAGLRAVLQAARAALTRGSEFAVCGMSPSVKRVFEISGMKHLLQIHGELPC